MRTRAKETNQYQCHRCERKYAVGEAILVGTLGREALRRRGGRKEGFCHCGAKFSDVFGCSRNVMYDMLGAPHLRDLDLPRVVVNTSGSKMSSPYREISERVANDEEFANSVRRTALAEIERMLKSSLRAIREFAASMMTEPHCIKILSVPGASDQVWFQTTASRIRDLRAARRKIEGRRAPLSRVTPLQSRARGGQLEATA